MIAVKESKLEFNFITLRDCPSLRDRAAEWFHEKWGVPADAYLECMTAYLNRETEYGWYLCLNGEGSLKMTSTTAKIWHRMSARYIPKKPAAVRVLPGGF